MSVLVIPSVNGMLLWIQSSIPLKAKQTEQPRKEILEDGVCSKVESLLCDEKYKARKLFTSVFGVGLKTADKWYGQGFRTLEEIKAAKDLKFTKMQKAGFCYYEDINSAVTRPEADAVGQIIENIVKECTPDASLTLTGGFRSVSIEKLEDSCELENLWKNGQAGREESLRSKEEAAKRKKKDA
ncbi:hypothetical protein scyTo_0011153 [Scyliorhinus torazame]|uniref:DNA-directed DNA polymerase X domain-containing protein n=1 Tax=Scyliorhinus torazame TaxID=75743 RepID=A0A401NI59_SCYTO|nr:hypothetical protein [Scyliorhinus torazame]